jgi:uncharacterized protein YjiS (DUF1127 family)
MSAIIDSSALATRRPPGSAQRTRLVGLLGTLLAKALFEVEMRRALREIERFDDMMLRDIGLDRGGLEHPLRYGVADSAAPRTPPR